MKKLMMTLCAALAGAFALPSWAAAEYNYSYVTYFTPYAAKDTDPGDANLVWYKAYGMTQATARELLSKTTEVTYLDVAAWLANDFAGNSAAVVAKSQALTAGGRYSSNYNQYKYIDGDLFCFVTCDDYIGVVFFDNGTDRAYCVLAAQSDDLFSFDDEGGTDTTGWQVPAISYLAPEYKTPDVATSGIDHWATNTAYGCTVVTSATEPVTWEEGWYVVMNDVTITGGVTVKGEVNLILGDGASLWVNNETESCASIAVNEGNTLAIYGQKDGTGRLDVFGNRFAAAIGSDKNKDSGAITVNGGIVTAVGAKQGAGIGGGDGAVGSGQSPKGGKGQNITINGGMVTATGGQRASGIGGSVYGAGENITVNGGTVTATGGENGAGIGGGYFAEGIGILIQGGTVTAIGDKNHQASGIGSGVDSKQASSGLKFANHVAVDVGNGWSGTSPIRYTEGGDCAADLLGKSYVKVVPSDIAVGATGYSSLARAFWDAEDGDTVTLYADVTTTGTMVYPNKFPSLGCTLDLAEHTLTFNATGYMFSETVKDGLSIWSNNVFRVVNGTLTTTADAGLRDVIRFYGTDLTLDDVTLDGTNIPAGLTTKANAVLTIESGNCTVQDGTITAPTGAADNTLYAIKFGNHSHPSYTMGTLDLEYGTVTGDLLLNGGTYDEMGAVVSGRYFYGRNIHSVWEGAWDVFAARTGVLPETGAEDNFVGQLYKDFADALAAAQAKDGGDTVTLLGDMAYNQDVTLENATVIDAAGYRYIGTGSLTIDVTKAAAKPFIHLGTGSSCSAGHIICTGKEGYEAVTDAEGNLVYGIPKVQLGVVAQRYPWNGILDVNYRTLYTPPEMYTLKLKVEVEGAEKEATCIAASGVGSTTVDLKEAFGEVKGKAKVTATLEKMDE